jgi:hypothetical protein
MLEARKLPLYEFANGAKAFYFLKGALEDDRIWYTGLDHQRAWRQVVGFKTVGRSVGRSGNGTPTLRYWHFGLQAKPVVWPAVGYMLKPRVLFSDDGQTIWTDVARLHRARRSQCRNWWNAKWRDLIAATLSWLSGAQETLRLDVGSGATLQVPTRPLQVIAPISYDDSDLGTEIGIEDESADLDELDEVELETDDDAFQQDKPS